MLTQFDAPDALQGLGRRVNTTVAPQALFMMNNAHVRAAAREFAARLKPAEAESPAQVVRAAYRLALGRPPSPPELRDATEFLQQQSRTYTGPDTLERATADFCQAVLALLALNEFVYVN
jgi:hypothetical protein